MLESNPRTATRSPKQDVRPTSTPGIRWGFFHSTKFNTERGVNRNVHPSGLSRANRTNKTPKKRHIGHPKRKDPRMPLLKKNRFRQVIVGVGRERWSLQFVFYDLPPTCFGHIVKNSSGRRAEKGTLKTERKCWEKGGHIAVLQCLHVEKFPSIDGVHIRCMTLPCSKQKTDPPGKRKSVSKTQDDGNTVHSQK